MIEASDEKADGGYYSVICGLEHKTACFNKLAVTSPTGQITARNGSVAQRLSILSSKARKSPISRSSSRPSSRWSSTSRRQTGSVSRSRRRCSLLPTRWSNEAGECLLLAQSGHPDVLNQCPLLGVKRTSLRHSVMSAFDPGYDETTGSHQRVPNGGCRPRGLDRG